MKFCFVKSYGCQSHWAGLTTLLLTLAALLLTGACKKSEPTAQQSGSDAGPTTTEVGKNHDAGGGNEVPVEKAPNNLDEAKEAKGEVAGETPAMAGAHEVRPMEEASKKKPAKVEPSPPIDLQASEAVAPDTFETVTDPTLIKVRQGAELPKRGDKIYTEKTLPQDACGTYWVRDLEGFVEQMSICRDEH